MLSLKVTEGTFPNIIFDWGETATPTERTCKQSKIIQRIEDIRGETYISAKVRQGYQTRKLQLAELDR